MKKLLDIQTIKIALAASTAIFIANVFGVSYAVTAGIMAILGIQGTKKETFRVAGRRVIASIISIILAYILFLILGNSPIIFGLFLIIYIPITKLLKIEDGIMFGAVLATHLLTITDLNEMWIMNEIKVTLIGIIVSLIFNLYMPSLEEEYEEKKEEIEKDFKVILSNLAENLMTRSVSINDEKLFNEVSMHIKENIDIAYKIKDNYLFKKEKAVVKYMDMRLRQFDTIVRMRNHSSRVYMTFGQAEILADFTVEVAKNIFEDNDCRELLEKLKELRENYKNMELPKSREEFENRSVLFQFLNDLEDFLIIKREYIKSIKQIN